MHYIERANSKTGGLFKLEKAKSTDEIDSTPVPRRQKYQLKTKLSFYNHWKNDEKS